MRIADRVRRPGRHAVLVGLAAIAGACAQSAPEPGVVGGGPTADSGDALDRRTRIASADIGVETRGAWTYRRTPGSSGASGPVAKGVVRHGLAEPASGARRDSDEPTLTAASMPGAGGGAGAPAAAAPGAPPPKPGASRAPGKVASGGDDGRLLDLSESSASIETKSAPGRDTNAAARALRAGATDDNSEFSAFLQFLDDWQKRPGVKDRYQPLDVGARKFVRVVDKNGRPVPAARVAVVDEVKDRVVGRGTTYGDGRVPVYPRVGAADGRGLAPAGGWFVEVRLGDQVVRSRWDGAADECVVNLGTSVTAPESVPIDVAFLIDTTGSMGDEIASIQACLLRVTEQIRGLARETDLRCGTVLYRDVGDEYLTATHPLTADVGALDTALREVRAGGGGDGPESLNQGLAETVDGLQWRDGAAKVVFLVADAPPHMDYAGDTPYGESVRAAVAKGIRVHTVAASGIDEVGSLVFRQIAQYTRGKFIFLEYGGDIAKSGAAHGVGGGAVQKNDNLEDILFEQIRDEVAHFGR